MANLLWLTPLLSFTVGACMLTTRRQRVLAARDVLGALAVLALVTAITVAVVRGGPISALGVFRADHLAILFLLLIGFLAVAVSLASIPWMRHELASGGMRAERLHYYYALVHGFIGTMLVTVLSDNLGILWIAMEGTTITSALLVGFHGDKHGLEAAWKYIIVTTIGISFGLFGTVLVYGAAVHAQGGFAGAMNYSSMAAIASRLDPGIIRIGFIFVMVGYGTKAGLAPVHMWLPDAHSQAPTPVSALLSGALIKCALFGIIRFHTIALNACGPAFSNGLLLIFGVISVAVAAPFILAQQDLKRLLGYSSVEHVGIIALGLGFGGRLGTYAALLHVLSHGVTKALVFLVAGDAISRYGTRDMRMMGGLLGITPLGGTLLMAGAFSLAGTPPFSVFMSEMLVIKAGLASGRFVVVAAFLVLTVVIFAGLIRHAGQMVFGTPGNTVGRRPESPLRAAGLVVLVAAMVLLGVYMPAHLDGVLTRATEIVVG